MMKERVSKLKYPTLQHSYGMAIPSLSDGQSDRKPVSPELHKIMFPKV